VDDDACLVLAKYVVEHAGWCGVLLHHVHERDGCRKDIYRKKERERLGISTCTYIVHTRIHTWAQDIAR
jgi:hypothetical protein